MEAFFIILIIGSLTANVLLSMQVREMLTVQKLSDSHIHEILGVLQRIQNTASLTNHHPQPPIKPNNWESMRKAFEGPVRMNHERT